MRRRALLAVGVGAALAATAAPARRSTRRARARGAAVPVSIGFDAVAPQHLDVLLGDTVTWTNDSVRTHTVTADDGAFDSGRVVPTGTYTRTFTALGDTPTTASPPVHPRRRARRPPAAQRPGAARRARTARSRMRGPRGAARRHGR